MKFFVVSMVIAFVLATLAAAMPVQDINSRAAQAVQETNAQRLARGLPPLKPRAMGTPTEAKRQAPSAMRRQAPSAQRRAPGRLAYRSDRDRYAGIYASV
ncbi:hypothetical protein EV122DRAFT_284258 [Schizophyllum commune]|nr:hypothetical protein K523DRAFT_294659 [Schizophyllum commune Tattone D]